MEKIADHPPHIFILSPTPPSLFFRQPPPHIFGDTPCTYINSLANHPPHIFIFLPFRPLRISNGIAQRQGEPGMQQYIITQ